MLVRRMRRCATSWGGWRCKRDLNLNQGSILRPQQRIYHSLETILLCKPELCLPGYFPPLVGIHISSTPTLWPDLGWSLAQTPLLQLSALRSCTTPSPGGQLPSSGKQISCRWHWLLLQNPKDLDPLQSSSGPLVGKGILAGYHSLWEWLLAPHCPLVPTGRSYACKVLLLLFWAQKTVLFRNYVILARSAASGLTHPLMHNPPNITKKKNFGELNALCFWLL